MFGGTSIHQNKNWFHDFPIGAEALQRGLLNARSTEVDGTGLFGDESRGVFGRVFAFRPRWRTLQEDRTFMDRKDIAGFDMSTRYHVS